MKELEKALPSKLTKMPEKAPASFSSPETPDIESSVKSKTEQPKPPPKEEPNTLSPQLTSVINDSEGLKLENSSKHLPPLEKPKTLGRRIKENFINPLLIILASKKIIDNHYQAEGLKIRTVFEMLVLLKIAMVSDKISSSSGQPKEVKQSSQEVSQKVISWIETKKEMITTPLKPKKQSRLIPPREKPRLSTKNRLEKKTI